MEQLPTINKDGSKTTFNADGSATTLNTDGSVTTSPGGNAWWYKWWCSRSYKWWCISYWYSESNAGLIAQEIVIGRIAFVGLIFFVAVVAISKVKKSGARGQHRNKKKQKITTITKIIYNSIQRQKLRSTCTSSGTSDDIHVCKYII